MIRDSKTFQSTDDLNLDLECAHTYFDGTTALERVQWTEKGFVSRCALCGEICEQ